MKLRYKKSFALLVVSLGAAGIGYLGTVDARSATNPSQGSPNGGENASDPQVQQEATSCVASKQSTRVLANFAFPSFLLDPINTVASKMGFKMNNIQVGATENLADCCKGSQLVDWGIETDSGRGTVTFSAQDEPIPGCAIPEISEEFDAGIGAVTIEVNLGLYVNGNIQFIGNFNKLTNACDPSKDCYSGDANLNANALIKVQATASGCFCSSWTGNQCGGVQLTPGQAQIQASGQVSYNEPCGKGLNGRADIANIIVSCGVTVFGVSVQLVHTWPGFNIFNTAA